MPNLKIALTQKRSTIAAYSLAGSKVRSWLVYLPESGADFQGASRANLKRILGGSLESQFNYLVVNKPGVLPRGKNPAAFERSFRRKLRIRDALTVMDKVIPESHEIFLVGYSEGGYLAPQVALLEPRTKGVVMIGGGTRGWLKEELSNAGPLERAELGRKIREIHKQPHSKKMWNGFSFATWYSYREDSTLKALTQLRLPMLAVIGERDRTIDFKSARQDFQKLMKDRRLKLKILSDCGHSFVGHWADAWHEVRKFLDYHSR